MSDTKPPTTPDQKVSVLESMQQMLHAVTSDDPKAIQALRDASLDSELTLADRKQVVVEKLQQAINDVHKETQPAGQPFHSRSSAAGIVQSSLEANILPELQGFSEGNPVVWIPAGIKGLLEHCNAKYPFQNASDASAIEIPEKCTIALLADWGADNDHAKAVAAQAMLRQPDYMIHLGDIYYSGSDEECRTFLKNWPMKDADGLALKGRGFALNGNHEMYSLGKGYFSIVLPAFGQEASYFTLSNNYWQLHGLDTAYVPFSISGGLQDTRLQSQWDWLKAALVKHPEKRNILMSHNQPVSAHLPELEAAQALMDEARKLLQEVGLGSIYGWFFGHEHRCTIYDDEALSALFKARLIGSGAIGHHPQQETEPAKDESGAACAPFVWVNKRSLEDKGVVAVSSFALLHLDGKQIDIEYIDEDGYIGYRESWHVEDRIGLGTHLG